MTLSTLHIIRDDTTSKYCFVVCKTIFKELTLSAKVDLMAPENELH